MNETSRALARVVGDRVHRLLRRAAEAATEAMLIILPVSPLDHHAPGGLGEEERAGDVDVDHLLPPVSGVSSGEAPHDVPALLTRMSTPPSSATARSTTAWTCAGSRTSQARRDGPHADRLELGGGLLAALHLARAEDEVGAALGERVGHLPAEAAPPARHDRRLAGEVEEVADVHHDDDPNAARRIATRGLRPLSARSQSGCA